MVVSVGIALGSNLGDRQGELDAAVIFLRSLSVGKRLRESPRMETAPVGCPPGTPRFFNAVVEIELEATALPPRELLHRLQEFELSRGRPTERAANTSRPLDLDIIYYGDARVNEPGLIIPHPRAKERLFVLKPLAALRPDLVLPGEGKTVVALLGDLRETALANFKRRAWVLVIAPLLLGAGGSYFMIAPQDGVVIAVTGAVLSALTMIPVLYFTLRYNVRKMYSPAIASREER